MPFAILQKHWPDVPKWRDIFEFTAEDFRGRTGIDDLTLITGGFPCQPFSTAGKRGGRTDDRYLWPEMLRCIKQLNPRWIVAENVFGITSLEEQESVIDLEVIPQGKPDNEDNQSIETKEYFGRILPKIIGEIEEAGYVFPKCTDGTPIIPVAPACAVNADHRRFRVFIIAHSERIGSERGGSSTKQRKVSSLKNNRNRTGIKTQSEDSNDTNTAGIRRGKSPYAPSEERSAIPGSKSERIVSGRSERYYIHAPDCKESRSRELPIRGGGSRKADNDLIGCNCRNDPNMHRSGSQGLGNLGECSGECSAWSGAWETSWFEAATRLCGMDDGISRRVDRLKCLGNAVVPAQVYPILKAIADYENTIK